MQQNADAVPEAYRSPMQVGMAPYISVAKEDQPFDKDTSTFFFVGVYRSNENHCEFNGDRGAKPCETVAGIYYGTDDPRNPLFCPLHYYEYHFGPDAPSTLLPIEEVPKYIRDVKLLPYQEK